MPTLINHPTIKGHRYDPRTCREMWTGCYRHDQGQVHCPAWNHPDVRARAESIHSGASAKKFALLRGKKEKTRRDLDGAFRFHDRLDVKRGVGEQQ